MLFLVIIPCILYFLYAWRRRRRILQGVLPPECGLCWPIIGVAHLWITGTFWERLISIQMDCLRQGCVTLLHSGINPNYTYYVVCDPDDASIVSEMCLQKGFLLADPVKAIFGNGLATASVPDWMRRRKCLEEVFNQLLYCTDISNEQAGLLTEELETKSGKGNFDPSPNVKCAVMKILMTTIFSDNKQEEEFCEHVDLCRNALESVFKTLNVRHKNIFTHSKFIFNFSKSKSTQDEAVGILNDFINEIIKKKTATGNEDVESQVVYPEQSCTKFKGLLDYLLELKEQNIYTEDDIVKEIVTVLFSGYFTISYSLINVLKVLGSYLMVQEKAYDEIIILTNKVKGMIKEENLSQLPYLDAVLMETLRLYPPVTCFSRIVDKEVKLSKYKLESNNNCLLCVYALNRHSKWGENVECFKPERWLGDAVKPFAGFGLGERNCLGKLLSLSIMKILLVNILKDYVISTSAEEMTMKNEIFLHCESGHHISLGKRPPIEN